MRSWELQLCIPTSSCFIPDHKSKEEKTKGAPSPRALGSIHFKPFISPGTQRAESWRGKEQFRVGRRRTQGHQAHKWTIIWILTAGLTKSNQKKAEWVWISPVPDCWMEIPHPHLCSGAAGRVSITHFPFIDEEFLVFTLKCEIPAPLLPVLQSRTQDCPGWKRPLGPSAPSSALAVLLPLKLPSNPSAAPVPSCISNQGWQQTRAWWNSSTRGSFRKLQNLAAGKLLWVPKKGREEARRWVQCKQHA